MARKKVQIAFVAPITITLSLLCVLVFILEKVSFHGILDNIFTVGGNASSTHPFDRASFQSYITIFTHIFGHTTWVMLALNCSYILLLGPQIEEAYGKALLLLMIAITAFVNGIASTLFVSSHMAGAQGIVILFIIVTILSYAKTKEIPMTIVIMSAVYTVTVVLDSSVSGVPEKIIPFIGALCASIFGFIDFFEQSKPVPRKKRVINPKTN